MPVNFHVHKFDNAWYIIIISLHALDSREKPTMITSFSLLKAFFLSFMLDIKPKNCSEKSHTLPSLTQNAAVQSNWKHLNIIHLNKNPTIYQHINVT